MDLKTIEETLSSKEIVAALISFCGTLLGSFVIYRLTTCIELFKLKESHTERRLKFYDQWTSCWIQNNWCGNCFLSQKEDLKLRRVINKGVILFSDDGIRFIFNTLQDIIDQITKKGKEINQQRNSLINDLDLLNLIKEFQDFCLKSDIVLKEYISLENPRKIEIPKYYSISYVQKRLSEVQNQIESEK